MFRTALAFLFVLVSGPAFAGGLPAPIGDHGGPHGHAHWPVRVRHLEKIEWKWSGGAEIGMAVPAPDGLLRIQAGGGTIHGVDPLTGKTAWRRAGNTRFFNYSSCALGADGVVYGGNQGFLSAVKPDGSRLWRTSLKASWIHRPPAVSPDGRAVYFVSDGVGLASLDARTGEVNWLRREFGAPWAPMVFDEEGRLVIGWPKRIVCFAENGAEVWSVPGTAKHLLSVPGRLVVGRFRCVEALDPSTRKPRWKVELGSRVAGLALGDDGLLVASLDSGELVALDLDGRLRWRKKLSEKRLGRPATVAGGETLVMDLAGVLRLVGCGGDVLERIETGAAFWRWRPTVGPDGRVYVNHQHEILCIGGEERPPAPRLVATGIVVAADDFVVDVWVNGKLVPMERRRMLAEVFGATTEKISVDLREGDWIVFNVVANRLRWGGARYFGAYGVGPDGRRAFVTQTESGWYACDRPSKVGGFIRGRDAGTNRPAVRIENPWSGGAGQFIGRIPEKTFPGEPIWGTSANTWLKFVVVGRSSLSPSSGEGSANTRPSEE